MEAVEPDRSWSSHGLDSVGTVDLATALSEELGRPVPVTLLWDHPTPAALVRALTDDAGAQPLPSRPDPRHGAIAVVGMACRVPGADDVEGLWRLVLDGVDAITEVPADRWDADRFVADEPAAPGFMATRWGGFLSDIRSFDAGFFEISPREALEMDPQQRVMLELTWDAIEDAGLTLDSLRRSPTGVFVGAMWSEYDRVRGAGLSAIDQHSATGRNTSVLCGRISYSLGLTGPSITVNTACSSSLVAVHMACQSLRSGESSVALVGGVNLILGPQNSIEMTAFGGMSPDGRCKVFDARADGYVRSEGAAMVVLKPLRDALADGDRVHAWIRGSAVNSDGASNGLTAPSGAAQQALLGRAYADAGVDPARVHFVETHGTGTRLGDVIETSALGSVLGTERTSGPLRLGAIKSNLGHLESAAGIVGLLKTVLTLRERTIAPNLHFERPSPQISFDQLQLSVPTTPEPWPQDAAPLAGVSAFGFGGTNAHVVLEGPPRVLQRPEPPRAPGTPAAGRVAFVFTGNGSQWAGMGRGLLTSEPVFRSAFLECDAIVQRVAGVSMLDMLAGTPSDASPVLLSQLSLFALQVALTTLWRSWDLVPDAVVGHSVGEIAAAHAAGALALEDAVRAVCQHARAQALTPGSMAVVGLPADALAPRLEDDVDIAAHNGPSTTVISGPRDAVAARVAALTADGVRCWPVRIDFPAHSRWLRPHRARCAEALADVRPRATQIPMVSSVTGEPVDGTALDGAYWATNMVEPVRFHQACRSLVDAGCRTFVEIGPHPILKRDLGAIVPDGLIVGSLRRDAPESRAMSEAREALGHAGISTTAGRPGAGPWLLPISARSSGALRSRLRQLADVVDRTEVSLEDLAWTLGVRRDHHPFRRAFAVKSRAEALMLLRAASSDSLDAPARETPALTFVFSGQGSQREDMGRELLGEPTFEDALTRVSDALRPSLGWSVLDEIRAGVGEARLRDVAAIQPLLFAVQVAIAATLRAHGIEPGLVVGHSMGEVAAAHVAGILSLADAAAVIVHRSRVLAEHRGQGGMLSLPVGVAEAERIAAQTPGVTLAVVNGEHACVLSGEREAITRLGESLVARGIDARAVAVDVPAHSDRLDGGLPALARALEHVAPRAAEIPMVSSIDGGQLEGPECDAAYWVRNLRRPVRFDRAMEAVSHVSQGLLVEVAPHPVLLPMLDAPGLPTLRRGEPERPAMLEALAQLFERGADVHFAARFPNGGQVAKLPAYPWQRTSYWPRDARVSEWSESATPALGRLIESSVHPGTRLAELCLDVTRWPEFGAHRLSDEIVVSAGMLLGLALGAATDSNAALADVRFDAPVVIDGDERPTVQLALVDDGSEPPELRISQQGGRSWTRCATARMTTEPEEPRVPTDALEGPLGPASTLYDGLARHGVEITPALRTITHATCSAGEVIARMEPPRHTDPSVVRGRSLDAAFQALAAAVPATEGQRVVLASVESVGRPPASPRGVIARVTQSPSGWVGDAWLVDTDGSRWPCVRGANLALLERRRDLVFSRSWIPTPPQRAIAPPGLVVIGAALHDSLRSALERRDVQVLDVDDDPRRSPSADAMRWVIDARALPEGESVDVLLQATRRLVAVVDAAARSDDARVILLTRGSADVEGTAVDPHATALASLARVVARESPGLGMSVIDVSEEVDDARLAEEVCVVTAPWIALRAAVRLRPRVLPAALPSPPTPRAGAVLITGGLGALGRQVATGLVDRGWRDLVLLGRRPPSPSAQRELDALRTAGARVTTEVCDVTDLPRLRAVVDALEARSGRLAGVMHLAGIVADALLTDLEPDRFRTVLAPKIEGAWNLHRLPQCDDVDFFVLFSSVGAWLGLPGQGSYAAANAFLDGFAAYRRSRSRPATSVAWCGWQGRGFATDPGGRAVLAELEGRGIQSIDSPTALSLLEQLLATRSPASVVVAPGGTGSRFEPDTTEPTRGETSLLGATEIRAETSPTRRQDLLTEHVRAQLSVVLRAGDERLDADAPFKTLGVDSLMAVELTTRLRRTLELDLPRTTAWSHPSIRRLVAHLDTLLAPAPPAPPTASGDDLEALLSELEGLSDDEVARLLEDEHS